MMPNIGLRNRKDTRFHSPSGFKTFLITNVDDIELLLMNNRSYQGEIAHNISGRKRVVIIQRAKELNVRLTNANAKVRKTPTE